MTPRPKHRNCFNVDGVLLLDKPAGLTSNHALQAAKRLLQACKAGHTGSLDPIATGLLPLCFGDATRVSQFLLDADKRYWAVFRLGVSTATYDIEGEVTATRPVAVSAREVEQALAGFRGDLQQIPPMYSAIKRGGEPLYKLARAGVEVEREARHVTVREFRVLGFEGDRLEVEIACTKGTYVRSLAHELGEALGCGAHVAELRRLGVGQLALDRAITLEALEALPGPQARAERLIPMDAALGAVPDVRITKLAGHYLRQGQAITARHEVPPEGWVRIYEDDRFLGMGQILDDGRVAPRRLLGAGRTA
jgi:tRNA pseudouridine55 synthase